MYQVAHKPYWLDSFLHCYLTHSEVKYILECRSML